MKCPLTMAHTTLSRRMTCWCLSPIIAFDTMVFILVFRPFLLIVGQGLHIVAGGGSTVIAVSLLASVITALATCLSLVTAVGITRCDVVLGNLLHYFQAVAYNTLPLAGTLVLEGATGEWFINQSIFGTGLLGHGSWFTFWQFIPLSLLAAMAMGTSVVAVWLWRGTLGPLLHVVTTMTTPMTTLQLISLYWDWVWFVVHFNAGWLAGSLALATVLVLTGIVVFIHRASIRGSRLDPAGWIVPGPAGGWVVGSLCMTTQQVPPLGQDPVSGEPLPIPRPKDKGSRFVSCLGLTLVVGLIAVGFISLPDGWDTTLAERDRALPVVAVGETMHADPFDAKFLKAFQTVEAKPIFPSKSRKCWLFITMEATNITQQSIHQALLVKSLSLKVDGLTSEFGSATTDPVLYRLSDGPFPDSFQPDLTQKIVAVWRQDDSEPLLKELTATLSGNSYRESSSTGEKVWFDPEEKFSATLTMEELKQQ